MNFGGEMASTYENVIDVVTVSDTDESSDTEEGISSQMHGSSVQNLKRMWLNAYSGSTTEESDDCVKEENGEDEERGEIESAIDESEVSDENEEMIIEESDEEKGDPESVYDDESDEPQESNDCVEEGGEDEENENTEIVCDDEECEEEYENIPELQRGNVEQNEASISWTFVGLTRSEKTFTRRMTWNRDEEPSSTASNPLVDYMEAVHDRWRRNAGIDNPSGRINN